MWFVLVILSSLHPFYYLMQKYLYLFCLLATNHLSAQTATGSWYGRADVELSGMHNNYLTEMVLKQKGNRVEGIFGYYFRDKYQSFFVHGHYDPKTRQVIIENIPLIYFNSNSTVNSIDCNTNFVAVIINSKTGSTLKGAFYHDQRYKYTCPDLKVSYALDKSDKKQDSVLQAGPVDSKIWKPQVDDYVVDVAKTDQVVAAAALPVKDKAPEPMTTTVAAAAPAMDTTTVIKRVDTAIAVAPVAVIPPAEKDDSKKIAEDFARRKEVLNQVLEVESDSVRLSFYDNGDIDGDSISIFVNKRMVLTHQELAAKAMNVYLRLDSTLLDTEISMFAENLGKFPPNTALMVVTDGVHRYEVFMSSSLTENSTIQLRRKRKP